MYLRGITYVLLFLYVRSVRSTWAFGTGVVLPNDPYIYIGNNLTLTCNLTKYDPNYDSRYLHFSRKNDEVIPSKYVTVTSTRTIVLRYPITSPEDGGNYICKLNRTNSRLEIIGNQFVTVEYEPKPVTEIDCRVYNWQNMTCTWDLGVQFVHPNSIDVKLIWTTRDYQYECRHQERQSCSWKQVDGEDSFMNDVTYIMAVRIVNTRIQRSIQAKAIKVDTSKIVEPAPVTNLTAVKNSTCITLTWTHEKKRRDKVYVVMFKSELDTEWKTKHVEQMEIFHLQTHPHTRYDFNVSCKPRLYNGKVHGFWSKGVAISVLTNEDIPTKAPEISVGSYVETPCQHICKKVTLYWKPVSSEYANGNITHYRLDYRNLDDTKSKWETTSVTETQELLMLVPVNRYVIKIRAATGKGMSNVSSEIYMLPAAEKPTVPRHIVEAHNLSQETTITISWDKPQVWTSQYWRNLTSYTVYWCRGYRIERRCQDPINSAEVPISQNQFVLSVNPFHVYMFGVAVNAITWKGNTKISSGFKWNTCTYIKHTKPEVALENVRLSLYQPNRGVSLEWDKLTCHDTDAYVQSYIISICPTKQGDNCTGDASTFIVDNTMNSFTIEDLEENTEYKIWVNAVSEGGLGPESKILYSVVIDKSLNPGEISGIVIAALFVLIIFLFGIILCTRRVFQTVKQKYFVPVPIEVPHTLPPLPPIPMPPQQLSSDSDCSEGIYEKIAEGPPSPCSSTESTTGVEAPLIHSKWKLSTLKNQLYGKKKDQQRNSHDSGRGSLSHSADTLLMRLHPTHLKKHKKSKKSNKSESDSGVIVDGRGQVCSYTSNYLEQMDRVSNSGSHTNCHIDYSEVEIGKIKNCGEVNPYSCVNIVDKINSNSETLKRKALSGEVLENEPDTGVQEKGSTMSLPPGFCKMSTFLSQPLDYRAKSAGNELDLDDRSRLSSMKEAREFVSSDMYSEDGTLDSVGDNEHETSESVCSQEPTGTLNSEGIQEPVITSYIKFVDGEKMVFVDDDDVFEKEPVSLVPIECRCSCHGNKTMPAPTGDGYVDQNVMVCHLEENCGCEQITLKQNQNMEEEILKRSLLQDMIKEGKLRPVSQAYNLPPHYFGSMSMVPVDPATTTEL